MIVQIKQIILQYYYTLKFYNCTKNIKYNNYSNRECIIDKSTYFRAYQYTIHDFTANGYGCVYRPSKYLPTWQTYVPENYITFKEQYMSLKWLIIKTQETICYPRYSYGPN